MALKEIGFTSWCTKAHFALAPWIRIATGLFANMRASLGHPLKHKSTLFSSANCSHWLQVLAKMTKRRWKTGRQKLCMIWNIKACSHMKWRTASRAGTRIATTACSARPDVHNNKDGIAILCWKAECAPRAPAKKRLQTLNPASKYPCQQHLKGFSLSTFQWRECQINSPSSPQSQQRLRRQTLAHDSAEDGEKYKSASKKCLGSMKSGGKLADYRPWSPMGKCKWNEKPILFFSFWYSLTILRS